MPISLDNGDLVHLNNGDSNEDTATRTHGYKHGGGRCVFSATGGSSIAAHGLSLIVPAGAVLTRVCYKVLTTFTSATDAATIALKVVGANDIISAVAISNGANPWDSTSVPVATLVTHTLSSNIAVTADSEITATVAVEALTAGKLVIWAEWMYHGDLSAT
jgi:hypothetical protein